MLTDLYFLYKTAFLYLCKERVVMSILNIFEGLILTSKQCKQREINTR